MWETSRRLRRALLFSLSACLILGTSTHLQGAANQTLTVDKFLSIQQLEDFDGVAISPGGSKVAFVLDRSRAEGTQIRNQGAYKNPFRGDVWLADVSLGRSINITNGNVDRAGFWAPKWSPDGQSLAMLSTRGGRIGVWIYNLRSKRLQRLTSRDEIPTLSPPGFDWLTPDRLLIISDRERGESDSGNSLGSKLALADERETTASSFEGSSHMKGPRRGGRLVVKDTTVCKTVSALYTARMNGVSVSPNHQFMVMATEEGWLPKQGDNFPEWQVDQPVYGLSLLKLSDPTHSIHLSDLPQFVRASYSWSPDNTEVAVRTTEVKGSQRLYGAFRCNRNSSSCVPLSSKSLSFADELLWRDEHLLVICSAQREASSCRDVGEGEHGRSVGGKVGFRSVMADPDRHTLVGIMSDKVAEAHDLSEVPRPIATCPGQTESIETEIPRRFLLASALIGHGPRHLLIDLAGRTCSLIAVPSASQLAAFDPSTGTGVFSLADETGTYLWVTSPQAVHKLLEKNTFLEQMQASELRRISYRSVSGADLVAWVMLPPNFTAAIRYPVITWVYPGTVYDQHPPTECKLNNGSFFNLNLLTSRGYVVLLPSMPEPFYGNGGRSDYYSHLAEGVLPAIKKLIEMGLGDSKRVAVMGHSAGGYATNGLISITHEFKAAVSIAGISDLTSFYGSLSPDPPYYASGDECDNFHLSEDVLGTAPWKDPDRYIRNSPVAHAGEIVTPLLLIHGAMDCQVPMEQSEEMFIALHRQDKPVEFVRYGGEGHNFDTPADIKDMWQRIYDWLDEFLDPE